MNKGIFTYPDGFSVSPLMSLLPVLSEVNKLEPLTSFFYARYEKVRAIRKELDQPGADSEGLKMIVAEQVMLEQVLDWLEVTPASDE